MPSLSQIMKSKTLMFGLLLTLASVAQILVPYLPPAYVGERERLQLPPEFRANPSNGLARPHN